MSFFPAPKLIRKSPAQIEEEKQRLGGGGQVNPFMPNPRAWAHYRILQEGREVGHVYVSGTDVVKDSTEIWQLYTGRVTGTGRAAYTWPSYQDSATTHEARIATLQLVYEGNVESPGTPDTEHQQIIARIAP